MKDNNKKFSSIEKLLPLLQQLQKTNAKKCHIFWLYTMACTQGHSIFVIVNKDGRNVGDFSFYWFNEPETLERKYNELCDCLKQV